mgnify:CR=1 FL=1
MHRSPIVALRYDSAQLAPKPESPPVSGRSTPNSVAMLGPDLSCRLPCLRTFFSKTRSIVENGGPRGRQRYRQLSLNNDLPNPLQSRNSASLRDQVPKRLSPPAVVPPAEIRSQFPDIGDRGVGAIEGTKGERRSGCCQRHHVRQARQFQSCMAQIFEEIHAIDPSAFAFRGRLIEPNGGCFTTARARENQAIEVVRVANQCVRGQATVFSRAILQHEALASNMTIDPIYAV